MTINYIHEPTNLQCGQAVLAMLLGTTSEAICERLGNYRETTLKEMRLVLSENGISMGNERKQAFYISDLPECAVLSLETPRCWHWSLFYGGVFYDPEHGVMKDFPECRRKYFWEVDLKNKEHFN